MKLSLSEQTRVYMYCPVVDMRKAIDGLSQLVIEALGHSPQSGDLFVFRNRYDKVKILLWDKNGFVVYYKRLEKIKYKFPASCPCEITSISHDQLSWLLAGLDFRLMVTFSELNYAHYF